MGHAILERVLLFGTRSADYIRASGHNGCIATEVILQATTGRIHDHPNASLIVRFLLHRGITAPGILGPMIMRRLKKRKNLSSARHYDQIRFRFRTAKTHCRHESRTGGDLERVAAGSMPPLAGEEVGQRQGKLVTPM